MSSGEVLRVFVALIPPAPVAHRLVTVAAGALDQLDHARPTAPERIHLTLAFVKAVPVTSVDAAAAAVAAAAAAHLPTRWQLALTGAGAFPSAGRATVVWAGLDGVTDDDRQALRRLAKHVRIELRRSRIVPARTSFRPHVTLARMPRQSAAAAVAGISDALAADPDRLTFGVDQVHLVESRAGGDYLVRASSGPAG